MALPLLLLLVGCVPDNPRLQVLVDRRPCSPQCTLSYLDLYLLRDQGDAKTCATRQARVSGQGRELFADVRMDTGERFGAGVLAFCAEDPCVQCIGMAHGPAEEGAPLQVNLGPATSCRPDLVVPCEPQTIELAASSGTMSGAMATGTKHAAGALEQTVVFPDTTEDNLDSPPKEQDAVSFDATLYGNWSWYLWAHLYYPGHADPPPGDPNSFWVQVDQSKPLVLGDREETYGRWHWDGQAGVSLPLGFLERGERQLRVINREARESATESLSPRLDRLVLTNDPSHVPTQTGPPPPLLDQPFGGQLYGNPYHFDVPNSIRIQSGAPTSLRFRSERSSSVTGVTFAHLLNTSSGNGWSSGDCGKLRLKIVANGTDDLPSSTVLGQTAINGGRTTPLCNNGLATAPVEKYPHWSFESPVKIQANTVYHLVAENSSSSGYPSVGFLTANRPIPLGSGQHAGPFQADDGAVYRHDNGTGNWTLMDQHTAFMELRFADGQTTGCPYLVAGSGLNKSFGGQVQIRQRFTVQDITHTVDGLWFRVYYSGGAPADLKVQLEDQDGKTLTQLAIVATALSKTANTMGDSSSPPARWVYRKLAQPLDLELGRTYFVRFSATSGTYRTQALQLAGPADQGSRSRNRWDSAYAELSTDGGVNWRGLEDTKVKPGFYHKDVNLSLAFTVVNK